jgi:UDP-N-acetylglucosamine--N-acetylmuramyl-(pentapeptide) pyrophosphoryl-undecaprenol N-acetylglucosamine transferase
VCIAFGGFVAGPGGIAAKILGIPLVVHEQNARAGLTNRYLAKMAKCTLQAFPDAFSKNIKAITVGNPVRQEILALPEPAERLANHQGPLRILVLGGSLGALAINEAIVAWLKTFERRGEIIVKHQTGKAHIKHFEKAYRENNLDVDVSAYIDDMPGALAWADVVICRAGALTVSELAAVGVAGIFIPMPSAVDNHQFHNANFLAKHHGAIIIEQKNLSNDTLSKEVTLFIEQRERVLSISLAARAVATRDATQNILKCILKA